MTVFMPNGPNPTTGFVVFMPANDVIMLDMSVEDGAKLVVSAGLVAPQQEALRKLAEMPKPRSRCPRKSRSCRRGSCYFFSLYSRRRRKVSLWIKRPRHGMIEHGPRSRAEIPGEEEHVLSKKDRVRCRRLPCACRGHRLARESLLWRNAGTESACLRCLYPRREAASPPPTETTESIPETPPAPQDTAPAPSEPAEQAGDNADQTKPEGDAVGQTEEADLPGAGMILVSRKPVEVLASPSASAPAMYGFPAGRPFRVIGREGGFVQI